MKKNSVSLLIFIFFIGLMVNSTATAASSFDSQFYLGANGMVINLSSRAHIKDRDVDAVFPIEIDVLSAFVKDIVESKITTKKKIAVFLSGIPSLSLDEDKIYVDIYMTYWDSHSLTPPISHDLILVTVRMKRNVVEHEMSGKTFMKVREKNLSPLLISIPVGTTDLKPYIQQNLGAFLASKFEYLNCVNDGNCEQ